MKQMVLYLQDLMLGFNISWSLIKTGSYLLSTSTFAFSKIIGVMVAKHSCKQESPTSWPQKKYRPQYSWSGGDPGQDQWGILLDRTRGTSSTPPPPPPPVNRQTENITFPHTTYASGKNGSYTHILHQPTQ